MVGILVHILWVEVTNFNYYYASDFAHSIANLIQSMYTELYIIMVKCSECP
jgi:hypothetical protein